MRFVLPATSSGFGVPSFLLKLGQYCCLLLLLHIWSVLRAHGAGGSLLSSFPSSKKNCVVHFDHDARKCEVPRELDTGAFLQGKGPYMNLSHNQ